MSHNHPNTRTGSSTAPRAQSSAWTGAAVFSGKGAMAPHSAPLQCRAVQTSWSQLQGALCWHPLCGTHIPRATHCRPQRKPVPVLEIQLPAPKVQVNALKARSSFLLQFCAFFQTKLGDIAENSPISKDGLSQQAAGESHTYLCFLHHYEQRLLLKKKVHILLHSHQNRWLREQMLPLNMEKNNFSFSLNYFPF